MTIHTRTAFGKDSEVLKIIADDVEFDQLSEIKVAWRSSG